jgi:hypothetical protein
MAEGQGQIVVNTTDKSKVVRILVIGGVAIVVISLSYFGFIKPILNKIGLTKDKDDRQADRDYNKLSRSQALSPLFYRNNKNKITLSSSKANELAYNIYNAKGTFWDDESKAVGSIQRAGSLVNLSYISDVFTNNYGHGLQSYLNSFIESKDWSDIDNYIDKAKKF